MLFEATEYPRSSEELEGRLQSDEWCRSYLAALRWPDGFRCVRCENERRDGWLGHDAWLVRGVLFQCTTCGCQTSVTAGTLLQDTRIPLAMWMRAMWQVSSDSRTSSRNLQRTLGLSSYQTAWILMQKLRRVMRMREPALLTNHVEIDVNELHAYENGRLTRIKILVAVQLVGHDVGRFELRRILGTVPDSLAALVTERVEVNSVVVTRDVEMFKIHDLKKLGYRHRTRDSLNGVHNVFYQLRHWLRSTYRGKVNSAHLDWYMDDFVFRFSGRRAGDTGRIFHRLAALMVTNGPVPYRQLVARRPPRNPTPSPERKT